MDKKILRLLYFIFVPILIMGASFGVIGILTFRQVKKILPYAEVVLSKSPIDFDRKVNSIFSETSKASNQEIGTVKISEIQIPEINTEYGKFVIDSVNISMPLIFGDTPEALKLGAGQYNGSYLPGYGGTILITGHNYMFTEIESVNVGDIITIKTAYGLYKYKINDKKVISKDDATGVEIQNKKEKLIFYTCYPFNAMGDINARYFVYADLISGPKMEE